MRKRMRRKTNITLVIAEVIIQLRSAFQLEEVTPEPDGQPPGTRLANFIYRGRRRPHSIIKVVIVKDLPEIRPAKGLFFTCHPDDGSGNWRFLKKGNAYIYESLLPEKRQCMVINKNLTRATAYLVPKKDKGFVWNPIDIVDNFLQILLMHYLALRKQGILVHSVAHRGADGKGTVFAGRSGAGKTTLAKIWHGNREGMILNDDRIIVRKHNGRFVIYGTPWHGEFSEYLKSRIELASLDKLFFIHHAPHNRVRRLVPREVFSLLYPTVFLPFWNKPCMQNIAGLSWDIASTVAGYKLGFVNDEHIVSFVRNIA